MSYQVYDTTAGLAQSMKLLKPAMRGMPNRQRYLREYDALRRRIAVLIMSIEDGVMYFDPDGATVKAQKAATTVTKAAAKAA